MAEELTLENFIVHYERFWEAHKAAVWMAYRLGLRSSGQEEFSQRLARIDPATWDALCNIALQSIAHALNMACVLAYEQYHPDFDQDKIVDWIRTEGWDRVRQRVDNHALKSHGQKNL